MDYGCVIYTLDQRSARSNSFMQQYILAVHIGCTHKYAHTVRFDKPRPHAQSRRMYIGEEVTIGHIVGALSGVDFVKLPTGTKCVAPDFFSFLWLFRGRIHPDWSLRAQPSVSG